MMRTYIDDEVVIEAIGCDVVLRIREDLASICMDGDFLNGQAGSNCRFRGGFN